MKLVFRRLILVLASPILVSIYLLIRVNALVTGRQLRFGRIMGRIGHIAGDIEMYLCEKDQKIQPENTLDLFCEDYSISNRTLLNMWKRRINISRLNHFIHRVHQLFCRNGELISTTYYDRDILGLLEKSPIHLEISKKEEATAIREMEKMGLDTNGSFIGVAVRDDAYLNEFSDYDLSYHGYRNCSIRTYEDGIRFLLDKGHAVVRMGSVVNEVLNLDHNRYIEYAHEGFRSELLDIYLSKKCRFFISCATGIDALASHVFRRPMLYINIAQFGILPVWGEQCTIVFKKYRLDKENRYLSVREMIESGAAFFGRSEEFKDAGISVVDNTPEEIEAAIREKEARLSGHWTDDDDGKKMQDRFWEIYRTTMDRHCDETYRPKVYKARIGTDFLKQNRWLLDE